MIDRVSGPFSRFMSWWGRELSEFVSPGSRPDRGLRGMNTVVSIDKSMVQLIEERNGDRRIVATATQRADAVRTDPLALLDPIAVKGNLGIRVPFEACFARTLHVPEAAMADATALAALDLERATPFRAGDVMTAVLVDRSASPVRGVVPMRQLVLKRETVQPMLDALAARGLEAQFVDCWTPDRTAAMPLDFLASVRPASGAGAGARINRALAATVILGLVTATGTALVKQANALAILDLETKTARQSASAVGERITRAELAMADAARLRGVTSRRPPAVGVLDAVTQLLPDGTYLTELSLEGDQLDITGYATSAAPLLEMFEKSQHFNEARFSAPFRYDSREERERFSMRVRVKPARAALAASRVEAQK